MQRHTDEAQETASATGGADWTTALDGEAAPAVPAPGADCLKAGLERAAVAIARNAGPCQFPAGRAGIAILGSNPKTVDAAPFGDENWVIYACSPDNFRCRILPRFDQWFEVHLPIGDASRPYPYLKYLESAPLVWMRDQDSLPYFKGGRLYPEAEIKAAFGGPFCFTSSIAFMMAKAIVDCVTHGIDTIGFWGIMQASETEYTYQKPGIQHLIQTAAALGIRTVAHDEAKLFEAPVEGF